MEEEGSDDLREQPAPGLPKAARSSHQDRKKTKEARKAAAKARAAENMRLVAAAQAAGIVPKVVTRASLGLLADGRAVGPTVQGRRKARKNPEPGGGEQLSQPPPEVEQTAQRALGDPTSEANPLPENPEAANLFDLISERGLRIGDRPDGATPAPADVLDEVMHCSVRFAIETAAGPSIDWMTKCVRPPFDKLWLEYPHLEMVCGAMIECADSDGERYRIHFVTSSRADLDAPMWWPGPELMELTGGGSLAHRKPAVSDQQNSIAQDRVSVFSGVFDALYTHLALIHEVRRRGLFLPRTNTNNSVLPARSHALDGAVVLMWGDAPARPRSPLNSARHAPVGHRVRGHQRRLGDGDTTWVRPHRRGAGRAADDTARTYEVKQRGRGYP
jgi:hypothetical protein